MKTRVLRILAAAWALPVVALGRFLALLWRWAGWGKSRPFEHTSGVRARLILARGPVAKRMRAKGWGGVTIGDVVWFWAPVPSAQLIAHEVAGHVPQWRRWGIAFLPAYLFELARHGYRQNYFERQAREAAKA